MFRILGVLLALYVGRCLVVGDVYARAGLWGRTYLRTDDGWRFWSAIVAYSALALALCFVF